MAVRSTHGPRAAKPWDQSKPWSQRGQWIREGSHWLPVNRVKENTDKYAEVKIEEDTGVLYLVDERAGESIEAGVAWTPVEEHGCHEILSHTNNRKSMIGSRTNHHDHDQAQYSHSNQISSWTLQSSRDQDPAGVLSKRCHKRTFSYDLSWSQEAWFQPTGESEPKGDDMSEMKERLSHVEERLSDLEEEKEH